MLQVGDYEWLPQEMNEGQHLLGDRVAEVLIMRHKDQANRIALQASLQALNGLHVQV